MQQLQLVVNKHVVFRATSCAVCPVGQYKTGCSGTSPGSCTSCTGLPSGANWITQGYFNNSCRYSFPPPNPPPSPPPPPIALDLASYVVSFSLKFVDADYSTYSSNPNTWQANYISALTTYTGGSAVVSIKTIVQGSIIVSTVVAFPPSNGTCSAGSTQSLCGTFLATLSSSPASLFSSQPSLSYQTYSYGVTVAHGGQTSSAAGSPIILPSPPASVSQDLFQQNKGAIIGGACSGVWAICTAVFFVIWERGQTPLREKVYVFLMVKGYPSLASKLPGQAKAELVKAQKKAEEAAQAALSTLQRLESLSSERPNEAAPAGPDSSEQGGAA
jgi:hypothetical protein